MLKQLTIDSYEAQRTYSQMRFARYSVFRATHKPRAFTVVKTGLDRSVAVGLAQEQQRHAGAVGRCGVFYGLQMERGQSQGSQAEGCRQ